MHCFCSRPISLLSILSKLLERHVYGLIAEHVETHRPLSTSQWGFQAGKSTVTALLSTTHNIDGVMDLPLSEVSQLVLYADDILLYRPIKCQSNYSALQHEINTINSWVEDNHLQFNVSKCKHMLISRKRHTITCPRPLTIANHQLEEVECFKYLGLLFTSDLSWTQHIESICAKAR